MAIKIILLVVFFTTLVCIGIKFRKASTNVDNYVLGGRSVGPWMTAFSFGTSYFSAVIFVGYAGQFGWNFGVASTWIGLGNAFIGSLLAWMILGRRTRIMTQHLDAKTMPDFFGTRYGSKGLRIAASCITFIFLMPYTASLFNGLSRLFKMAFNVDYAICVIVMAALTAVYVILGGYLAAAVNDFIQGIIMLCGIIAVIVAVLNQNGGFVSSITALSQVETDTGLSGAYTSFFGPQPMYLLIVVLLTSLGTWGLPQMIGKFYAIANEDAIKKGTIISTLFAVIVAGGCYFLGGFGRLFTTQEAVTANGYDSIIPTMLSNLPDIIIGIVLILVLSASMSTLAALVLCSSSTLTLDFIAPLGRNKMTENKKMIVLRCFVAMFIIISAVIAIIQAKSHLTFIAQLMGISWGALAGSFLGPFIYGLYWKGTTKAGVIASFISGSGLLLVQLMFSLGVFTAPTSGIFSYIFKNSLYSGVCAMALSMILVPLVSVLSKKLIPQNVEDQFSCYNRRVAVQSKTSLDGEEIK